MLLLNIQNSNLLLFIIKTFKRNYEMNYTNYNENRGKIKKEILEAYRNFNYNTTSIIEKISIRRI